MNENLVCFGTSNSAKDNNVTTAYYKIINQGRTPRKQTKKFHLNTIFFSKSVNWSEKVTTLMSW